MLAEFELKLSDHIHRLPPLSYQDSLFFWKDAKVVLTDSGGLQEETTALGIPCLTLRENTERPITCEVGTNRLVGNNRDSIVQATINTLNGGAKKGQIPPKWDGKAGLVKD